MFSFKGLIVINQLLYSTGPQAKKTNKNNTAVAYEVIQRVYMKVSVTGVLVYIK